MFAYSQIEKSWPSKFLLSHSDLELLQGRPSPSYGSKFVLGEWNVHNRSGSTATVGIGGRIQADIWTMRTWDESEYAAGVVYTDETADAQNATTADVNLSTVAANGDGFVIGCDIPFNIVSLVLSQAAASNAVWQVYYSIASAGTGFSSNFTELVAADMHVAPSFGTIGEHLLWFDPPAAWHKATADTLIVNRHGRSSVQVAGLTPPSQYLLVVKATTAPDTTRGQINIATLGRMFMTKASVATASVLNNIGGVEIALPPQCDGIAAAISVANAQNRASVSYRYSG